MGIQLSFYNRHNTSKSTHMSYSTMQNILEAVGLPKMREDDYYVELQAKKVITKFQEFLEYTCFTSFNEGDFEIQDKLYWFVKQMVSQYNEMVRNGHKPAKFGGA